jgi:cellulose synthase operon protein C
MHAVTGEIILEDAAGQRKLAVLVEHFYGAGVNVRQRKGCRAGIIEHGDREDVSGTVIPLHLQQFDQALAAATRYAARNPRDLGPQKLIARLELETRHPDRAIESLSNLASGGDADAETYDLLGRAFALADKSEQALQAFQKAVERAADDAGLRLQLATQFGIGDLDSAVGDLERSLELAPSTATGGQFLVLTELAAGHFDETAEAANKLNKLKPDDPIAQNLDGLVKLARFDLDGAQQTFAATLKTDPDFASARLNLARIAELRGRPEEADAQLEKILAKDPTDLEALSGLVGLRLRDGDHKRAVAALESAQRAMPG